MPLPLAANLAMIALPTLIDYLGGNKKEEGINDLLRQLKANTDNAYNEQDGVVNSAYERAMNRAYGNLARSGLSNTGIANSTLSGITQQRGEALSQAKSNAENIRRQNQAMIAKLLLGYDNGSGVLGKVAGYGLSGLMQGMFNQNNPAMDWKKIFEKMFQQNQWNSAVNNYSPNYNVYDNINNGIGA